MFSLWCKVIFFASILKFFGMGDIFDDLLSEPPPCDKSLLQDLLANLTKAQHIQKLLQNKITALLMRPPERNKDDDQISDIGFYEKLIFPSSCAEAMQNSNRERAYQLEVLNSNFKPFYAYCMKDPQRNGSAWTVIMRRKDGSFDFFLPWTDYKHGFGALTGEHWLGLEAIHVLTNSKLHELWIHMKTKEGKVLNANYKHFAIRSESAGYSISALGSFSGNVYDALRVHMGERFSTKDKNVFSKNCPTIRRGAWWFTETHTHNRTVCLYCHLNGEYGIYDDYEQFRGIRWLPGSNNIVSVTMAIRPLN